MHAVRGGAWGAGAGQGAVALVEIRQSMNADFNDKVNPNENLWEHVAGKFNAKVAKGELPASDARNCDALKVKYSKVKVRAFTCPARTITSEMSQAAFYRLIERLQAKFPHRTLYLHDDLTCRVTVKGETHDGRHQWVSPGGPRTTANIGVRYLGRNARGLDSEANAVRVTGGTVCLI